ncbi:MAG: methyltransferase, FxLD system [Anaerolineae bacterium]|nr:methyltransferase, FxLD system [Anaerolineae bacterium]
MGDHNNVDVAALHQGLVDRLIADGLIHFPEVEAAFRDVPRHLFLPNVPVEQVYRDEAIVTQRIDGVPVSSSSQPAAMAIMLEQLGLRRGQRVLEIGAGTGYNAALMAHIVGEAGEVITVDIDPEIVDAARARLAAAGFGTVQVVCADGALGYPDRAPYDRIILTVGAWDIAPAWASQLKPDGRLLLPLWVRTAQKTVAFERANGHLESVSVTDCSFMRLRGAFAGPEAFVAFGPDNGLILSADDRDRVDPDAVYALLSGPRRDVATGVEVRSLEVWRSLGLWLALHEPGFCDLSVEDDVAQALDVPFVFGRSVGGGARLACWATAR